MQDSTEDFAIVTVSGPADEPFVQLNIEAIRRKNSTDNIQIYVIDNGKFIENPDGIKSVLDATVVDGVAQRSSIPVSYRGSYQHADALGKFFKKQNISQRYLLIIDPDFYVVMDNWIRDITDYMQKHDLAFFGAPWHPRWYSKYRYFPCVHFMCIDTNKVDIKTLDFSPHLPIKELASSLKPSPIINIAKLLYFMTLQRRVIGKSKDTGYYIFKQFSSKHKIGLLQPVMAVGINFIQAKLFQLRFFIFLEKLFPDRFSYFPKGHGYYTEKGFAEYGLSDLSSLGWEEFIWQNAPFGFHLRRFLKKDRDAQKEISQIKKIFLQVDQT